MLFEATNWCGYCFLPADASRPFTFYWIWLSISPAESAWPSGYNFTFRITWSGQPDPYRSSGAGSRRGEAFCEESVLFVIVCWLCGEFRTRKQFCFGAHEEWGVVVYRLPLPLSLSLSLSHTHTHTRNTHTEDRTGKADVSNIHWPWSNVCVFVFVFSFCGGGWF